MRPRGEEERARVACHRAVPERDPPQAADRDRLAVRVVQRAVERPALRRAAERVDVPVAEVADEQIAAEAAERARCERDAPRRVQRAALCDACDEVPEAVELVDVPACRVVVAVDRRATDVGDEHVAVDRVDAERRVPGRDLRVDERAGHADAPPARVIDVHARVVEVGRVHAVAEDRDAAEDRGRRRLVDDHDCLVRPAGRHGRRPRAQHPVLARVDEARRVRLAAGRDGQALARVRGDPGRPAVDLHGQQLLSP